MKLLCKTLWIFFLMPLFSLVQLQADREFKFDFSKGHDGWVGDFADYPVGEETFYELNWGWSTLPYPLPSNEKGMVLSGNNHSDDLLMFIKRRVEGLEPNTQYEVAFKVTIESDVPVGQMGIGGSPGESIFFKVAASSQEPIKEVKNNFYRINIDIGSQSNGGSDGVVIGDLANSAVDVESPAFMPKEMSTTESLKAKTDEKGQLWLLVGTDSGFEGFSKYYIANIAVSVKTIE